jgi:hypothetical protein
MKGKLVTVALLLLLSGCSQDELLQKFASAEDQATAKRYIDYLRAEQFSEIEAVADRTIKGDGLRNTLQQMADLIPDEEPSSTKLVGAQTMHGPDGVTKNITFEYTVGDRWLLLNVATRQKNDALTIVGFNVYPQAQSLEAQNRFALAGKTAVQYLVLILVLLFPLLTLYALVLCARTRMATRKWPWVLFILFGVGKVAVNWTTGEWQITPLAVQLLSASAFSSPYGPWLLAASLPLGAFVFLLKQRSLRAQSAS